MDILGILKGFWESSGLAVLTWREGVMILVSFVLLYLAIAKNSNRCCFFPSRSAFCSRTCPAQVLWMTRPVSSTR